MCLMDCRRKSTWGAETQDATQFLTRLLPGVLQGRGWGWHAVSWLHLDVFMLACQETQSFLGAVAGKV